MPATSLQWTVDIVGLTIVSTLRIDVLQHGGGFTVLSTYYLTRSYTIIQSAFKVTRYSANIDIELRIK